MNGGGYAYHVINRAVARDRIFLKDEDYAAFERVLSEVHERLPTRLLGYCLRPNHWHWVLWPEWPVRRRDDGLTWVNRPQSQKGVEALHTCIKRGRPFGSDRWFSAPSRDWDLSQRCAHEGGRGVERKRKSKTPDPFEFSRPL